MVIQPLIGNPYNGYINPYYWVDDHPRLYGNNGSLDPSTFRNPVKQTQPCKNTIQVQIDNPTPTTIRYIDHPNTHGCPKESIKA